MADTELVPSPTDRRRKQTVISHSYPDIQRLAEESEAQDDDDAVDVPDKLPSPSTDDDEVFKADTDQDTLDTNEAETKEAKVSKQENNDAEEEIHIEITPRKRRSQKKDTKINVKENVKENVMPDIVYDDTKPKRLSNPKALKLDMPAEHTSALHETINYLISPDEPDIERSPSRRRRKALPSVRSEPDIVHRKRTELETDTGHQRSPQRQASRSPSPEIRRLPDNSNDSQTYRHKQREVGNSPKSATDGSEQATRYSPSSDRRGISGRYEHSPETARRKVSSPVQRLIVKTGTAAAAASSRNRKTSLDPRLSPTPYDAQMKIQSQRRRKISSDARLEHAYNQDRLVLPTETPRRRKVSFDTSALINGTRIGPLNDEFIIVKEVPEHIAEEVPAIENGMTGDEPVTETVYEERKSGSTIPQVVVTSDDDDEDGFKQVEKENLVNEESSSGYSDEETDGYDNKGFSLGDDDKYAGSNSNISAMDDQEAAIIPHRMYPVSNKLSTTSLPAGFGRSYSSNELTPPKSILKTRREDTESLASTDSVLGKSFKVRKDSIALFLDQHGEVAIQGEEKETDHRFRCFGKDDLKQLWENRKFILEKYKLHLLVLALFLLTFSFVIVGLHFHSEHRQFLATSQKVFFDAKPRILSLSDIRDYDTLTGTIGIGIPSWKMPTHCYQNHKNIMDKACLKWKSHGQLDIAYFLQNNTQCYNITWNLLPGTSAYDCYDIGPGLWFGPLNMTRSQWPITSKQFTFTVSKSKHHGSGTFSSAVEYYWLSSRGEAVVIDSNYPLEISWNTKRRGAFCVIGKAPGDFYNDVDDAPLKMFQYTVCNGLDIQSTHSLIRKRFYPTLSKMPDKILMEYPHWSTVSDSRQFDISETNVSNVADLVSANKMKCSSIEIDGKWENKFGDLKFDAQDFGNMTRVISKVNETGCEISLNVYPFFSVHSMNFPEGMSKEYFVRDVGGTVPALLKWEHGVGAMLDVSNPAARDWFAAKVRHLASEYDINTFRLVYGSSSWFPHSPVFHIEDISPAKVKLMFADLMASLGNVVVESTSQSQHISSLVGVQSSVVSVIDKICLRNIIPDVLNLGLMGYPFVLSDGFETADSQTDGDFIAPSRDLFIRWMQLSAFLPAIRYTIKPWKYDSRVIEESRNLTKFHADVVLKVIEQSRDEIINGAPIIRPMWWNHSNDPNTFLIADQFFLMDAYLVAPVFCECNVDTEVAFRDIYIPKGVWSDRANGKVIIGPRWVRGYEVKQHQIPVFKRLSEYAD